MSATPIFEKNRDEIARILQETGSTVGVVERFNVSRNVARHWAGKLGIELQNVGGKNRELNKNTALFHERRDEIEKMLADGALYSEIANAMGVTRGVVLGWTKQFNLRSHNAAYGSRR